MSKYELLRGLYLGEVSNADLTSATTRGLLHVPTPLDRYIPEQVRAGKDVVLTGNPGDGKSHLARLLQDRGLLDGAEVELDLSATTSRQVLGRWLAARRQGAPMVLCANEGPLLELIGQMESAEELARDAAELRAQVGHLVAARPDDLASEPRAAVLVDLADRNLLDEALIAGALKQVCRYDFMPGGVAGFDSSAGLNLTLFVESLGAMERFGRLLAAAGRRMRQHVTFRQLWAAVAYALCRGLSLRTLEGEVKNGGAGLGTFPLDNLCRSRVQGPLIRAFSQFADPAAFPVPHLDQDLWLLGKPSSGQWEAMEDEYEAPAALWRSGKRAEAMSQLASLKRLVALCHSEGDALVERVAAGSCALPSAIPDAELLAEVALGVRRAYLGPREEAVAPTWLTDGLPLWVGLSYRDVSAGERPHVAVARAVATDLEVLRPVRAPWLGEALGPPPEVAWLSHQPSGVALRLDPQLLARLRDLAHSDGAAEPPEPVARFLTRLAGWEETDGDRGADEFAVLARPRGELMVAGAVTDMDGEARYA